MHQLSQFLAIGVSLPHLLPQRSSRSRRTKQSFSVFFEGKLKIHEAVSIEIDDTLSVILYCDVLLQVVIDDFSLLPKGEEADASGLK
jgi:hypothetical protein